MNNEMQKCNNSNVAERLQKAFEELAKDKEAMEEIKNRNLFKKLFSNNTRDLARLGISQNANISELNNIIQDILGICKNSSQAMAEMQLTIKGWQDTQNQINEDFRGSIGDLWQEFCSNFSEFKDVQTEVYDHCKRIASKEQIEKLCLDIKELGHRNDFSGIDIFYRLCESIKRHLSASWLAHNDKRKILLTVLDSELPEIAAHSLNEKQQDFVTLFSQFIPVKSHDTGIWENFFKGIGKINAESVKMIDAVTGAIDAVAVSEADRYVEYRNKLTQILSEFIDKGIDLDNQYTPELKAIRKRLFEGQFEIALIGEFQGGKSTTFNTLCGGREISPRGLGGGGVKTSAAVITAQNISDGETKNGLSEWAEITWLSVGEIKHRICQVLHVDETNGNSNLNNLLQKAWESVSPEDDDESEKLRIATLQYRVISSVDFDKISEKNIVGIDEFQKMVKFPDEWENRWDDGFHSNFTIEESLFSCVDQVLVRLDSPALRHLGCRITDCPGLFASRWDTDKASEVMNRANAIWYLLDGRKQIGQGDERALKYIKEFHWEDKCFFSLNCRNEQISTEAIFKTDAAKLRSRGFRSENLFKYNALLSFRLAQLAFSANELGEKDLSCLALESKPKAVVSETMRELKSDKRNIRKAIEGLIIKCVRIVDGDLADELVEELRICSQLTEEHIALLANEAGFNSILTNIAKWVVPNRARSILIDHGTRKCLNVLQDIQARKENIKEAATQTWIQHQQESDEAKRTLNSFIATWKEKFDFLNTTSFDLELHQEFFTINDGEIRTKLNKEGQEICISEWKRFSWKGKTNNDVNNIVTEKIITLFLETIKARLNFYARNIKESVKFRDTIYDKVTSNLKSLAEHWQELEDKTKLFDELHPPIQEELDRISFNTFNEQIAGKISVPSYFLMFFKKIGSYVGQFFKKLFTWSWDEEWTDKAEVEIKEFFAENKPIEIAYDAFRGNDDNVQKISFFLGTPRREYLKILDDSFEEMKNALDRAIEQKKKIVSASNEAKEQAADDADRVLTEIIIPYQNLIKEFETEVCRLYAESKE